MIQWYNNTFGTAAPFVFVFSIILAITAVVATFVWSSEISTFLRRYNRPIAAYAIVLCILAMIGRLVWAIVPHTKIIEKPVTVYTPNPGTNQYVIAMVIAGDNQEILQLKQVTAHSTDEAFGLVYSDVIAQQHPSYKCTMWSIQQKQ